MAIYMKVGTLDFDDKTMISADFISNTPDVSEARSQNLSNTLRLRGKILTATDAANTKELAIWANVSHEQAKAYKDVTVEVKAAGNTMRQIIFPDAFVVDYQEKFGDFEGIGEFELLIRQKKDKIEQVKIGGNY